MTNYNRRRWLQTSILGAASATLPFKNNLNVCRWQEPDVDYTDEKWMRLNWNENPHGPPIVAQEAIAKAVSEANHYPDPLIVQLKEELASQYGLEPSNFLITSGSTEVLCLMGMYAGLNEGEILTPWPSFPTILMYGARWGAKSKKVVLTKDYKIDFNQLRDGINPSTKVISICNPNNPTSTEVDRDELRSFCQSVSSDILICLDEAYIHFSKHGESSSLHDLVKTQDNIVVVRTFSKAYGLAGLRLGYAISHPKNIMSLQSKHTGLDFSISSLSLNAALAVMGDDNFIAHCRKQNQKGRSIVYEAFEDWGVDHAVSSTNFIYATSKRFVPDVVTRLRDDKILITKWSDMTNHIRISIQTPNEMSIFVDRVKKYLV